ncbi:hypothetical protein FRC00_002811 [Tulasnella sp. 408]|nr:hypothetical protein FRC00_002811 [Tulasnella sp. 408]
MTDSPDIAEELPQLGQYDPCAKAVGTPHRQDPNVFTKIDVLKRRILDGMSHYRIDPIRIQVTDITSGWGGSGMVVLAKFIGLPETGSESTLLPRARTAPFLEVDLAVKKLYWSPDDAEKSTKVLKSLANELSILATLSHPNIIHLIGFMEDMEKGDAWIVVPWAANGNIREFLRSGEYDIPERVSLIKDAVSGLEYLHTREPPVCHGDLKSYNIIVNSSYRAVIADLGSARIIRSVATAKEENQLASPHQVPGNVEAVNEAAGLTPFKVEFDATTLDLTLTGPKWSLRWAAPELVLRDEKPNLPSDMWSLGWICWEPSSTPSDYSSGGPKLRPVALLLELGRLFSLQNNTAQAEEYYRLALHDAIRTMDETAKADALIGMGEIYNARSRYQDAEKAFEEAREIHSRIGNDPGVANALVGLGGGYNARSRYQDAEKALGEAHEIYSRIGNDLGAANALAGLGVSYNARSRYQEAEGAFAKARETHIRICNDLGAANVLVALGDSYYDRTRYHEAEKAFSNAREIHLRIGNQLGAANASVGVAEVWIGWSAYVDAEEVLVEAHEKHSRIGNDLGTANALLGLGKSRHAQTRYQSAEKDFEGAHEIYSRIGNVLGAANALMGLGESYNTQWRYQKAEKAFTASRKIYSDIGNDLGAANALVGLGEIYNAQSRHQEAEAAFKEAYETHSRFGNNIGVANVLLGLGEIYTAQLKYEDALNAFRKAQTHFPFNNSLGLARTGILLYEACSTQLKYSEADDAFKDVLNSLSRLEKLISPKRVSNHPEPDCDAESIYSQDEETNEDHRRIEQKTEKANVPEEDPASSPMVPVAETQPNTGRQEQDLSEQLTAIAHAPVPATKELIDILQALGKAAPKAVRHKHKIYSILRLSRDICSHIMEIGSPHQHEIDSNIEAVLTRTEDYFALLDAIEERIHPAISTQFLDAPKTHPVFVVIKGLEYLETQVKCGVPDEPTREVIIDIATLLAQTLANTSSDDDDKSLQESDSLDPEADRDWLAQALAE